MNQEIINKYTDEILYNQLLNLNIKEKYAIEITENIKEQIYAIIYHWKDVHFRKALLVIGEEEAKFYEPEADLDVKTFVVVAIRNSLIEIIFSDECYKFGIKEALPGKCVKLITSSAIEYFSKVEFNKICEELQGIDINDKYKNIASKYPMAWEALCKLGNCIGKKVIYKNTVPNTKMKITDLKVVHNNKEKQNQKMICDTQSGINEKFSEAVINYLREILKNKNKSVFYTDCFKMITRNFEKLLQTMEILLENDKIILTSNYLITNSYIGKRENLYRAVHCIDEMISKMKHPDFFAGLSKTHQTILKEHVDNIDYT